MKITIENYILVSQEQGGFNLTEQKKATDKAGKEYIRNEVIANNISVLRAIKIISFNNLHHNPNTFTLQQYFIELKNENKRIEKLLDLDILKKE